MAVKTNSTPFVHIKIAGIYKWMFIPFSKWYFHRYWSIAILFHDVMCCTCFPIPPSPIPPSPIPAAQAAAQAAAHPLGHQALFRPRSTSVHLRGPARPSARWAIHLHRGSALGGADVGMWRRGGGRGMDDTDLKHSWNGDTPNHPRLNHD